MRYILVLTLLIISCKRNNTSLEMHYFMSAIIEGRYWEVSANNDVSFVTDYDNVRKRFLLMVAGSDPTPNVEYRIISIDFDFVPKKDKYFFNNTRDLQKDSGVIAVLTYKHGPEYSYKWSSDGYVEVDTLTKQYFKGTFAVKFKGDATDTAITTLTNGSFIAPYSGSSGLPWPGP